VLLNNEVAEHVPGCNMAFWRERLLEIGGFDPIYRAAGDDVDACWKLQDLEYDIRFHPAAIVWHHPRGRIREFWRQQVGYGKAEALVTRNHPDKFNSLGQAIWRGVVYGPTSLLPGRSHIYSGRFGEAPFQRLYHGRSSFGVLTGLNLSLGMATLTLIDPLLLPLPVLTVIFLLAACLWQGVKVAQRERLRPSWLLGSLIGLLHLLQPLARETGRLRSRRLAFLPVSKLETTFPNLRPWGSRLYLTEEVQEEHRIAFLEELRDKLRTKLLNARVAPAWEEADLVCDSRLFWQARLLSYVHGGTLNLRVDYKLRHKPLLISMLAIILISMWPPSWAVGLVGPSPAAPNLWSPGLWVAGVILAAGIVTERLLFGLRMHRGLATFPKR
jgi:hypothetical protein